MTGTNSSHARKVTGPRVYPLNKNAPRILKLALGGDVVRCSDCGALVVVDVPTGEVTLAAIARTHQPSTCQPSQPAEGESE